MISPERNEKALQKLKQFNIPWREDKFLSLVLAGEADLVKLFLIAGMNPETADRNGITALMWGAGKGHSEIVHVLLEHGAKVNAQTSKGKTPLMSAAYYGKIETLKILLDYGAERNLKDSGDKTAFDWARERKQDKISEILQK
jgi:ankyrin repeat protein